jgi:hypothetical protein
MQRMDPSKAAKKKDRATVTALEESQFSGLESCSPCDCIVSSWKWDDATDIPSYIEEIIDEDWFYEANAEYDYFYVNRIFLGEVRRF